MLSNNIAYSVKLNTAIGILVKHSVHSSITYYSAEQRNMNNMWEQIDTFSVALAIGEEKHLQPW